ncbi:MAG: monofunctional biosynthetic peptidoglycan transglycosylase [Acidobacteriota bacterium]
MPLKRTRSCLRSCWSCCQWPLLAAALFALYLGLEYLLLPDVHALAKENPAETSLMRVRNREALREGRTPGKQMTFVPLKEMSRHLPHAVTVAEDDAFYDHPGYDEKQIRKSIEIDWKERRLARGGSTITQQLARNLYLTPSKNPIRKAKELLIALRLEEALSKDRILELYLNVIEWGDGIYGAEAASRAYFGHGCRDLSPEEAATLAGIIPNPRERDPRLRPPIVAKRRHVILRLMARRGYLTRSDYLEAVQRPVKTLPGPRTKSSK